MISRHGLKAAKLLYYQVTTAARPYLRLWSSSAVSDFNREEFVKTRRCDILLKLVAGWRLLLVILIHCSLELSKYVIK